MNIHQIGRAADKPGLSPRLLVSYQASIRAETDMNYSRIYGEFIADRRTKESALQGYSERHHIIPRSLGGDNSPSNLIRLSAEDHVRAHLLLAKVHGGAQWAAVSYVVSGNRHHRIPTRRMILAAAMANAKKAGAEFARVISDATKRAMRDPDIRARHLAAMSTPEYKAAAGAAAKASFARPEVKAKHAASMAKVRPQIAAAARERFKNPEARHAAGNGSRGRIHPADEVARQVASLREAYKDPAVLQRKKDAAKFCSNTPEGLEIKRRVGEINSATNKIKRQYAAAIGYTGNITKLKKADALAWAALQGKAQ